MAIPPGNDYIHLGSPVELHCEDVGVLSTGERGRVRQLFHPTIRSQGASAWKMWTVADSGNLGVQPITDQIGDQMVSSPRAMPREPAPRRERARIVPLVAPRAEPSPRAAWEEGWEHCDDKRPSREADDWEERKDDNMGDIVPYGSCVLLHTSEIEAGTDCYLCAGLISPHLFTAEYSTTDRDYFLWRIVAAVEPGPRAVRSFVRFGERVQLMNMYFNQYIALDGHYLTTTRDRDKALIFVLWPHVVNPFSLVNELEVQRAQSESELRESLLQTSRRADEASLEVRQAMARLREAEQRSQRVEAERARDREQHTRASAELAEALSRVEEDLERSRQELESREEELENARLNARRLQDDMENFNCAICLERPKCVVFKPCKHLSACEICGSGEDLTQCPMCRQDITSREVVYT